MLVGHPIFWILVVAVAAPLLAEIPLGFRLPVVVLEVLLGILIGPHLLELATYEGFVVTMHTIGMAASLYMAGMELDFSGIKGRPLALATGGWMVSALLGIAIVGLFHVIPQVHAPLIVTLALCTTALGVLVPVFRDSGLLATPFGRLFMAAGTLGEVGPIVSMSLLLSVGFSTWQELGLLAVFIAIVGIAIMIGMQARPPKLLALLGRHMRTSVQLPVRISLLILSGFLVLSIQFGFEGILGAFAAGMVVGQATRGEGGKPFREKIEAVTFGWFYPFFFVGTGIKFDIAGLGQSMTSMLLVPAFALLFLVVRGAPVFLYRGDIAAGQRLAFALASAVPSLSILVVITEIGVRSATMNPEIATGLIGAALLSILLFPTIACAILQRNAAPVRTNT